MTTQMSSDLSERLSELFVQSAALYFDALNRNGSAALPGTDLLHGIASEIMKLNSIEQAPALARFKLLDDGLRDAAQIARSERLPDVADRLERYATDLSGVLGSSVTRFWD